MKPTKVLNIVGIAVGTFASLFAIVTIIMLGAHLDATNFPGSNLNLATYTSTHGEYMDADLEGQYVAVLNGYIVAPTPGCNSLVDGTAGLTSGAKNVCIANTDTDANNIPSLDDTPITTWTGWIVAPNCARSNSDPSECAIFGAYSGFSYCGQITFALFAIQTILFTAHSCIAVKEQATKLAMDRLGVKNINARQLFQTSTKTEKIIVGLTITWGLVTTILFIASLFSFQSLCDKIDTGLGRKVKYETGSVLACATTGCVSDYWTFFTLFAFTFAIFRIPNLLISFGVLDLASQPEREITNDRRALMKADNI